MKTLCLPAVALLILVSQLSPPAARGESPTAPKHLDLGGFALGPGVALVGDGTDSRLRIDNAAGKQGPFLLLEIDRPAVTKPSYAILGEIRYEGVEGEGFLETWNHFPAEPGGAAIDASYFTRTLGENGPIGKIRGDSGWRPFSLPFTLDETDERRPLKITWNLHLAGAGLVEIRNVRFLDGLGGASAGTAGGWWSPRTSGVLGGVLGALFGCWGSLARFLAAKRRRPAFARASFLFWFGIGPAAIAFGVAALTFRQPYHVWFLPFLFGFLLVAVGAAGLSDLRKNDTAAELRRIRAADI